MNKNWRASTRAQLKQLGKSFITRLVPPYVLQGIQKQEEQPDQYPKLPFATFVPFMMATLLWSHQQPSTRVIAGHSRNPILQQVSDIGPVSHQAVADRMRTVSHTGLRQLIDVLVTTVRHSTGRKLKNGDLLKLFDCTTISTSALLYDWAAPNGEHMAVRIALGIDAQLDCPYCLLDASETTSDNSVFPEIVQHLKAGETLVIDAGFTILADFRTIQEKGAYWVTRMANIYHIEVEHVYELPRRSEQVHEGWLLQSDSRILIGTSRSGGPLRVRQVVWLHPQTGDIWTLFTNHFDWKPKRILQAYQARWRIEVHIRWLKSQLKLTHLPSQDPTGVMAFFLLMTLAWLFLRLFYAQQGSRAFHDFSCRDALLAFQLALIKGFIQMYLDNLTNN